MNRFYSLSFNFTNCNATQQINALFCLLCSYFFSLVVVVLVPRCLCLQQYFGLQHFYITLRIWLFIEAVFLLQLLCFLTIVSFFSLSICCYLLFCCPFARFNVLLFFSVPFSSRPHSRFSRSRFCLIFFPAIPIGIVLDFFVFLYFSLSFVLSFSFYYFFLLLLVSLSQHRLLDVCVNQQLQ